MRGRGRGQHPPRTKDNDLRPRSNFLHARVPVRSCAFLGHRTAPTAARRSAICGGRGTPSDVGGTASASVWWPQARYGLQGTQTGQGRHRTYRRHHRARSDTGHDPGTRRSSTRQERISDTTRNASSQRRQPALVDRPAGPLGRRRLLWLLRGLLAAVDCLVCCRNPQCWRRSVRERSWAFAGLRSFGAHDYQIKPFGPRGGGVWHCWRRRRRHCCCAAGHHGSGRPRWQRRRRGRLRLRGVRGLGPAAGQAGLDRRASQRARRRLCRELRCHRESLLRPCCECLTCLTASASVAGRCVDGAQMARSPRR